jgi:hypothetical protein
VDLLSPALALLVSTVVIVLRWLSPHLHAVLWQFQMVVHGVPAETRRQVLVQAAGGTGDQRDDG